MRIQSMGAVLADTIEALVGEITELRGRIDAIDQRTANEKGGAE